MAFKCAGRDATSSACTTLSTGGPGTGMHYFTMNELENQKNRCVTQPTVYPGGFLNAPLDEAGSNSTGAGWYILAAGVLHL